MDRPTLRGRQPIVADARDPDSPRNKRGLSKRIETNAPSGQPLIRHIRVPFEMNVISVKMELNI